MSNKNSSSEYLSVQNSFNSLLDDVSFSVQNTKECSQALNSLEDYSSSSISQIKQLMEEIEGCYFQHNVCECLSQIYK